MATVTFNIPDNQLQRVVSGMLAAYPNNEVDANGTPLYTDNQWLKEVIRRFVVDTVRSVEVGTAKRSAVAAVPSADNTIS